MNRRYRHQLERGAFFTPHATAFSGLLDALAVSAAAAFSVRKLLAAYAGKCCNIRRGGDSVAADIGFLANGDFDAAAFTAHVNGGSGDGTGYVTKWYDQSGNTRDASQATAANQPQLLLNQIGGKPALVFNGSSQFLATASFASSTVIETFYGVANRTAAGSAWLLNAGNNTNALGWAVGANTAELSVNANVTATAADNTAHSIVGVANGSSTILQIDGTQTTANTAGTANSGVLAIGANNSGTVRLTGQMAEAALWTSTALSSANLTTLRSNPSAYYGTP